MDEPALYNQSGYVTSVLPILDRTGAPSRVVIIKGSYAVNPGGNLSLAKAQREIRLGDEHWGPPEIPDIRLPGDFCAVKPGTDFVLSGYAVPPGIEACKAVDVSIRVADRLKLMRVHGPRLWRRSLLGVIPGPSDILKRTPLAWSRAYGGLDLSDREHPLEEPRNPIGSGVMRDVNRLVDTPAPQIEAPSSPISFAGGDFIPVGCAPIGRSFEPRRRSAGTYNAAWIKSGYPARPSDYREEHENCASPDLIFKEPLRGGELVTVTGVNASGPISLVIPKMRIMVEAEIDGEIIERRPHLDTVLLDSDAMILELVWRTLYRCPSKMRNRFTAVRVQTKEFIS